MDTFICGSCQVTFHDINLFINHKNECVVKTAEESTAEIHQVQEVQEGETVEQVIHVQLADGQYGRLEGDVTVIQEGEDGEGEAATSTTLYTGPGEGQAGQQMCLVEVNDADGNPGSEIHLVAIDKMHELTREGSTTITTENGEVRVIVADSAPPPPVNPNKKRPGRPRKPKEPKPVEPAVKEPIRPELPEKNADGRYHCKRCKKAFGRERHYNTHRCLATTDYVDITNDKDLMSEGEEEEQEEEEERKNKDRNYEYRATPGTRPRGRPPKNRMISVETPNILAANYSAGEVEQSMIAPGKTTQIQSGQLGSQAQHDPNIEQQTSEDQPQPQEAEQQEQTVRVQSNIPPFDPEVILASNSKDCIPNIPVFACEEEKVTFEETLNVDLSVVDDMYKTHLIDQNTNEHAPPPASRTQSELSVFSCTVCDKVFKTVSHMRLHCLTHTDIKPFRCSRCNFQSNSKGNLYTHMRIHTGQFYTCATCSFHTPNKTHLLEHMATHSKVRQKCSMCRKDYNTVKSLINHIRKYHPSKAGKEYLEKFQGKQNQGTAVLHQCHICLRKFKKKLDRDRHLFIHNIKSLASIHECDLCEYTATRRAHLEQHFTKHRVVYSCALCIARFPSSVRLNQHLGLNHDILDSSDKWVDVFQQCIGNSLYLPEPDGSTDNMFEAGNTETQNAAQMLESGVERVANSGEESKAVVIEQMEHNVNANNDALPNADGQGSLQNPGVAVSNQENVNPQVGAHDPNQAIQDDQGEEMEVEMTEEALALENEMDYDIYRRLNFVPMKMEVFHKLRMTFGTEECEYCGRLFFSKSDFAIHVRTHTGERPFACEQCSYRASTRDSLKRHKEKEHENVTYVCQQCEFVASSRTQLWHHQQKHREPREMECTVCSTKYPSAKRLRIHLSVTHPNLDKSEVTKMFADQQRTQGRLGRKSHKCPFCSKMFMRGSADLQKHIWIHQGIKPFKCSLCPHACRSKNNLMSHMLRHSAEKPFVCSECNKAYKSRTALRWHIRTHKDGKIFRCLKCSYEAVQYSHLKRHMQTHDVVKRFVCQHCNYSANTLGYMKIHYTRFHKGLEYTHNPHPAPQMAPGTKVYRCLSCDYLFGNLSDIKRHLKVRHHVSVEDISALENIESDQPQQHQQLQDQSQMQHQVLHVGSNQMQQLQPGDSVVQHQVQLDGGLVQQTIEVPVVVDENGDQISQQQSEVQVVEMMNQVNATIEEQDASSALQALQYAVPQSNMDEQTASAVNILQQIIGMSKQGAFGESQEIRVQSEDGQSFVLNPDTIIVQQDGDGQQELVIGGGDGQEAGQQYVIQYVTPDQDDVMSEVTSSVGMEMSTTHVEGTEIVTEEGAFTDEQMESMEVVELQAPEMAGQFTHQNLQIVLPSSDEVTDVNNVSHVVVGDVSDVSEMNIEIEDGGGEVVEQIYTVEGEATVGEEEPMSTQIITQQ